MALEARIQLRGECLSHDLNQFVNEILRGDSLIGEDAGQGSMRALVREASGLASPVFGFFAVLCSHASHDVTRFPVSFSWRAKQHFLMIAIGGVTSLSRASSKTWKSYYENVGSLRGDLVLVSQRGILVVSPNEDDSIDDAFYLAVAELKKAELFALGKLLDALGEQLRNRSLESRREQVRLSKSGSSEASRLKLLAISRAFDTDASILPRRAWTYANAVSTRWRVNAKRELVYHELAELDSVLAARRMEALTADLGRLNALLMLLGIIATVVIGLFAREIPAIVADWATQVGQLLEGRS